MKIIPIKTRVFEENENIISFILKYVKKIPEGSVLVVTSKIVALSEGRTFSDMSVLAKEKLIKAESDFAIKTKLTWLTIKDGMVMASAGIDESNAKGKLILLPKDSFRTAEQIRFELCKYFKIKNLGIIIADSGLLPLRNGVIGIAQGYAGFNGVRSYKGKKDIFGRKFIYSSTNIVDSLATGATLCMGEGNEQQPLALIIDAPVIFTNKIDKKELRINSKEDIFYPLFKNLLNDKKR